MEFQLIFLEKIRSYLQFKNMIVMIEPSKNMTSFDDIDKYYAKITCIHKKLQDIQSAIHSLAYYENINIEKYRNHVDTIFDKVDDIEQFYNKLKMFLDILELPSMYGLVQKSKNVSSSMYKN